MDLKDLRTEIDRIDDKLVRLFAERMGISARIAEYKKAHNLPWMSHCPAGQTCGYFHSP